MVVNGWEISYRKLDHGRQTVAKKGDKEIILCGGTIKNKKMINDLLEDLVPGDLYKVSGCIQGHGMDADKFYNVVWEYSTATSEENAKEMASLDGMWVERVEFIKGDK
jgi:hypothetical protein